MFYVCIDLIFRIPGRNFKRDTIPNLYMFPIHNSCDLYVNEFPGQTANELITNNGNDVVLEIGQPVIKAIVGKVVRRIQNFLEAVPLEDLVLD